MYEEQLRASPNDADIMQRLGAALAALVVLGLWIFCLIDVITTDESQMRNLPKLVWLLFVLFFPLVGSVAWLVAGRPDGSAGRRSAHEREVPHFPEYDRPGRAAAVDPEKDEAFLRQIRERAEEQRRRYEASRRAPQTGAAPAADPVDSPVVDGDEDDAPRT